MGKFREFILSSETRIFLGKNAENNDELMNEFKGKENVILHTLKPGSPFCVIEKLKPSKEDIYEAGVICAAKSQDWRDNKQNVKLHIFSGKQIKKPFWVKKGTWKINGKPKDLNVKKSEIKKWINKTKEK